MDWIAHVTAALFSTYRGASKLPDDILAVEGYSSPLVRRLLNNLCDFDGCRYVEVGTWQGATALSASYLNRGSFKAIDNFSEFGGPVALRRPGHVEPVLARELHVEWLVERVIPGGDFAYEQVVARQCPGSEHSGDPNSTIVILP
jgi:hypothetical protein